MFRKILLIIVGLIIVGGLAWFVDKNYFAKNISSKQKNNEPASALKLAQDNQDTSEKIIYVLNKDGVKEIERANFKGEEAEKIYSDENEDLKIKKFGGYAYLPKEILVLIGQNDSFANKLAIIKSDGSRDIIVESFGNPNRLTIAPDGKIIAYVFFSNVEADYGYSLFTMSRDGSNKRQIKRQDSEIKGLAFNKDASKIAFLSANQDGKSEIHLINLDSTGEQTIYSTEQVISSISWSESNNLVVSAYLRAKNNGEVAIVNNKGKVLTKVITTKEGVPIFGNISADDQTIAFLEVKLKDGSIDESSGGQILTVRSSGKNLNKVADGLLNIGWLP